MNDYLSGVTSKNAAGKIIEMQKDLTWLIKTAKGLKKTEFYGELKLTYHKGRIIGGKVSYSIRPE